MSNALTLPGCLAVDTFDAYLGLVKQMPTLSAEQEHALAVRLRDSGDLDAARQLVMGNLRFVVHVAKGYRGYGLSMPDLIQEGNVGLMKAVKRFDPDIGVRLITFAVHWIKAEIHEYIIKNWGMVKVATTKAQRKLFFNLRKSKGGLGWLSGDEAKAIARDLNVGVDSVYEMERRMANRDLPFDPPADDGAEGQAFSPAAYLRQDHADPSVLLEEADWESRSQQALAQALAGLDERSRDIVASRWLVEDKATLTELAQRYQVSAERVRQLEKSAMKKLKMAMTLVA